MGEDFYARILGADRLHAFRSKLFMDDAPAVGEDELLFCQWLEVLAHELVRDENYFFLWHGVDNLQRVRAGAACVAFRLDRGARVDVADHPSFGMLPSQLSDILGCDGVGERASGGSRDKHLLFW